MKKTIILSLCALAALSCAKEQPTTTTNAQTPDVKVVPATINATFDDTKLGLNGTKLVWEAGDQIRARFAGLTWTDQDDCDLFTAVNDGSTVKFTGNLTYIAEKALYLLSVTSGYYDNTSSASVYNFTYSSEQTGLLSDIRDYTLAWGKTDAKNVVDNGNGGYDVTATLEPLYSLLKFNVAENLGVAKIVISGNTLGGLGYLNFSRAKTMGYGSGNFLNLKAPLFNSITVSRNGSEISGDVYVVVAPDNYDTTNAEFYNDTETLSISFYDAGDNLLKTYSKKLKGYITNRQIMNLGNITSFGPAPTPEDFDASLTIQPSATTGNAFVHQFKASSTTSGVKFYYEASTTSMDAVATPTTSSAEIPAAGVPVSTSTAYDCQYVKILATRTGCPDKYIQAVIRHWLFGKGYTLYSGNGLVIPFDKPGNPDAAYYSSPVVTGGTSAFFTAKTILGGKVSLAAKVHAGSNTKTFGLWIGNQNVSSLDCAANQYTSSSPAFFATDNVDAALDVDCKLELKAPAGLSRNFYIWNYAILEWQEYSPVAASQAKVNVDALSNGSEYNF